MKVLLTGCGYVGSAFINAYRSGNQIRCLDNGYKPLDHLYQYYKDIDFISGDITNYEDCLRALGGVSGDSPVEAIVHTAAIVGFPECKERPDLARSVNVGGTETLLRARDHLYPTKPPRFVYCSTGSVYGRLEETCTEESSCNPQSLYGQTKLEAEEIVASAENTVSLRFATGCGLSPKMRFNTLINELCYDAFYEKELVIAEPDARRTFVDVYDMAYFLYTCAVNTPHRMTYGISGRHFWPSLKKVYNAGSDDLNMTKRRVAELIKAKTGCNIIYNDFIKDADMRNYTVSYRSFTDDFLIVARNNLNNVIENLLAYMPLYKNRKLHLT